MSITKLYGAIVVIFLAVILVILFFGSFTVISPGQVGVRVTLGHMNNNPLTEGIHMKWPIVQDIKKVSLMIQKDTVDAEAATKDLQTITTKVVVNWSIPKQNAAETLRQIGNHRDILDRIIVPAVNETLKAATAKRSAENILIDRSILKAEIDEALATRLDTYGIKLVDLSLVNFDFSPDFNKAIEEKQIAEQNAKKAVYVAQQAEQDAQATINRAKGEAEAKALLNQSVTPKILSLEFIQKWDGHMPTVISGDSKTMLLLDKALMEAGK